MSDVLAPPAKRTILRQLPKIIFYSDQTIQIQDVRASYPHLDKPWAMSEKGVKKYQIVGLIPKTPEYLSSIQALNEHIDQFLAEKRLQPLPQSRKCLRNGDEAGKPEMMGHWTISAAERDPPMLRGRHKDLRTGTLEVIPPDQAAKVFYGGCWVHLLIKLWYQEHDEGGRRVNANLFAVQFVRDDKAFGRGRISDEVVDSTFGEIPDDDGGFAPAPFDL